MWRRRGSPGTGVLRPGLDEIVGRGIAIAPVLFREVFPNLPVSEELHEVIGRPVFVFPIAPRDADTDNRQSVVAGVDLCPYPVIVKENLV